MTEKGWGAMNYNDIIDENFDELAKAIVHSALKDYEKYYSRYLKNNNNVIAKERLTELKSFFNSEWFGVLCDVDAEVLISEVERQCKAKHEAKILKTFRRICDKLYMF
jgi:hypothetical protein